MDMNDNLNSVGYDSDLDSGDDTDFDLGFGNEEPESMDSGDIDLDSNDDEFESIDSGDSDLGFNDESNNTDLDTFNSDSGNIEPAESGAIDPDSPEELAKLLESIKQQNPKVYEVITDAKTAPYCVSAVLESEQNKVVQDAIRFAACTTVNGGEYYYCTPDGRITVTDIVRKEKISCRSVSQTIINNLDGVKSALFTEIKCQGCKAHGEERTVTLADFRGKSTMIHDDCGCEIRTDGSVVNENAKHGCGGCEGGASVDEDTACETCLKNVTNLKDFRKRVCVSLAMQLQMPDGMGFEIDYIVEEVAKRLQEIYLNYAMQLKAPMGVLVDHRTDEANPFVTVCSGIKVGEQDLPGTGTTEVNYTSMGNVYGNGVYTNTNYLKYLPQLSAAIKEAEYRASSSRSSVLKFTQAIEKGNFDASERAAFFGLLGNNTSPCLYDTSAKPNPVVFWSGTQKQFISRFSAGAWHSAHVFGRYPANNATSLNMYANTKQETVKNEDGTSSTVTKTVSLYLTEQAESQLKKDISQQIWGFLFVNAGKTKVKDYNLKCWQDTKYTEYGNNTLADLIDLFNKSKGLGRPERLFYVIREVLRYLLITAIDYLMTFVVVLDCTDATISFDMVHFLYENPEASGGVYRVGQMLGQVFEDLKRPDAQFIMSLSSFRDDLCSMPRAGIISNYNEARDFYEVIGDAARGGIGKLGGLYISRYTLVLDPEAHLGYPLFAYQPISRLQTLTGKLDSNAVLIGETMQGLKVPLEDLLRRDCVSLFAASRSGKGVMTLAMLGTLLQSGNPVIYLDGKPEMSGVLVDFILSLNEIAKTIDKNVQEITLFPTFEFYLPCTQTEMNDKSSTYVTKMSGAAKEQMHKLQRSWLKYVDGSEDDQKRLNALWGKYFHGEHDKGVTNALIAPVGQEKNEAFSYLFRVRAYYLFYAMGKNATLTKQYINEKRLIVISDEVNRCNISTCFPWFESFANTLYDMYKPAKSNNKKNEESSDNTSKESKQNLPPLFSAFACDYIGTPAFAPSTGKLKAMKGENDCGLTICSAIENDINKGSNVSGTGKAAQGIAPLYVLIGQRGSEIFAMNDRQYYTKNSRVSFTHRGKTFETYLMQRALSNNGVCIQGNWTADDNNEDTEYYKAVIAPLKGESGCVYEEVKQQYLHFIDDSTISGFFAVRQPTIGTQIARTYLVLNNNIAEYTEGDLSDKKTENNVRPRTHAAIIGREAAMNAKNPKLKEIDAKLDSMLFRETITTTSEGKRVIKKEREPRVGFLGYFGMLLGCDLPDHVFDVTAQAGEIEDAKAKAINLDDESKARFMSFFNTFRDSCNNLDALFLAMPFVQYINQQYQSKHGKNKYNHLQDFIYDCEPASFLPLSVMRAESLEEVQKAFAALGDDPFGDYANKDLNTIYAEDANAHVGDSEGVSTASLFETESMEQDGANPVIPVPTNYSAQSANTLRNTVANVSQNTTATSAEFESEFDSVTTQLNGVLKFLNMSNYHDSFVTFEAAQGDDDTAMQLLHEVFDEANKRIDVLYDNFETYLIDETGSDSVYGKELNTLVSKCNALSKQWEDDRKRYWSRH